MPKKRNPRDKADKNKSAYKHRADKLHTMLQNMSPLEIVKMREQAAEARKRIKAHYVRLAPDFSNYEHEMLMHASTSLLGVIEVTGPMGPTAMMFAGRQVIKLMANAMVEHGLPDHQVERNIQVLESSLEDIYVILENLEGEGEHATH